MELLVVIAIIGLLASLLVPTLKSAQESARSAMCQSNLRQIAAALSLYVADNEGYLPPYNEVFSEDSGQHLVLPGGGRVRYPTYRRYLLMEGWFKSGPWPDYPRSGGGYLAEYLGTSADARDSRNRLREPGEHGVLGCPSMPPGPNETEVTWLGSSYPHYSFRDVSYGFNYYNMGRHGSNQQGKDQMMPLTEIERPARLVSVTETKHYAPIIRAVPPVVQIPEDNTLSSPDPRHNGRYNALFLDGHVISTTWEENWKGTFYFR